MKSEIRNPKYETNSAAFGFLFSLLVIVGAVTLATSTASAQIPGYTLGTLPDAIVYNDFVVGPGKTEVILNPGESKTINVSIANRLGTEKTFGLSEEDFTGSNDPNQPVVLLGDDRGPYSLKDFIHIGANMVSIPHAQKAFIPVTISIPANAQPGGFYGSVVVSVTTRTGVSAPNADGNTTASNPIITRLATLFFVRVAGTAKEEGKLTQFSLAGNKTFFFDTRPLTFDLIFQNSGNVHLVPHGTITVANMLGAPMAAIDVDPWFAMPQSLRFREVSWTPPFLFGRYTAHAQIARGYGSTTDEMDVVFWVIPWKIILGVFVGLILLITIIRFIFRWVRAHVRIVPMS